MCSPNRQLPVPLPQSTGLNQEAWGQAWPWPPFHPRQSLPLSLWDCPLHPHIYYCSTWGRLTFQIFFLKSLNYAKDMDMRPLIFKGRTSPHAPYSIPNAQFSGPSREGKCVPHFNKNVTVFPKLNYTKATKMSTMVIMTKKFPFHI